MCVSVCVIPRRYIPSLFSPLNIMRKCNIEKQGTGLGMMRLCVRICRCMSELRKRKTWILSSQCKHLYWERVYAYTLYIVYSDYIGWNDRPWLTCTLVPITTRTPYIVLTCECGGKFCLYTSSLGNQYLYRAVRITILLSKYALE